MATKIKADLIFEYNILPVYSDDNTKVDLDLSTFDYGELMEVLNIKNDNEFTIVMVDLDFILNRVSVFSQLFVSDSQQVKAWFISDFTAPQQIIINDFIALL